MFARHRKLRLTMSIQSRSEETKMPELVPTEMAVDEAAMMMEDEENELDEDWSQSDDDAMPPPPVPNSTPVTHNNEHTPEQFVSYSEQVDGDNSEMKAATPAVARTRALRSEFHSPSDSLMSPCTQVLLAGARRGQMKKKPPLSHPASILREKQQSSIPPKLNMEDDDGGREEIIQDNTPDDPQ